MELTDGHVTLRAPRIGDAPWVAESCADPELERWLPMLPRPYVLGDAEWWIEHCTARWADGTAAAFIIEDTATRDRLGTIELRLSGDVGYWLAPNGRGRGAMTRALRLVTRYAVERCSLARVELFTLPGNLRSQAVAERAGYRRAGTAPARIESRDGSRHDAFRFVIDAAELGSAAD